MVHSLQDSIRKKLNASKEGGLKKQISLSLNEGLLRKADNVVEEFKKFPDGNGNLPLSRNQLIEDAIEEYVIAAADVLFKDHMIDIEIVHEDEEEDNETREWDLLFCPALNKGFEEVFLGENQWYAVRIASWRIPHIKYIACYRGAPYSAITHYAEVDKIEPYKDTGKYIIYFKGEAISLDNPVVLGSSDITEVRKRRYTSLEKLQSANEVSEVWLY